MIGATIGSYRIVRQIGEGGMGATTRRAATTASWSSAIGLGTATIGALVVLVFRTPKVGETTTTARRASPIASTQTVGIALTRSLP